MKLTFDSSVDDIADAFTVIKMLDLFIDHRMANADPEGVGNIARGVPQKMREEFLHLYAPRPKDAPRNPGVWTVNPNAEEQLRMPTGGYVAPPADPVPAMGFIPGPVAAAAPSDAGAAASQTAPEAPTAGVPPPPTESAPPAAAPTASSAPAAPTNSAQGVDVTGLPWDIRIHAANAGKNADGRWRKKKGLNDAAYVARIETELRTGGAPASAAPPASAPPPPTLTDVVVPPPPLAQAPAAPTAPVTQQLATPTASTAAPIAPPPPPAGPDVSTFPGFLQWLTPLMTTGKLPFPIIMAELAKHGMSQLSDLNDPVKAQKLPEIYAALAATVK